MNYKEGLFKHKKLSIALGILIYFILLGTLTKVMGAVTMIASIALIVYLFKSTKFKETSKLKKSFFTIGLIFIFLVGLSGLSYDSTITKQNLASDKATQKQIKKTDSKAKDKASSEAEVTPISNTNNNTNTNVNGKLKISYIDVGQADSILIQQGTSSMLIDAGNNADSETVKNYISNQGITTLDYVIGTHPHEDHIGGMDYIINSFKIGKIYMPKATSITKTFQDVITAIKNKGMQITTPVPGDSFKLGDATCTILAPNNNSYDDLNNYSIVIKISFGSNKFMFDGDAGAVSEMEMIKKGFDVKADVLKVGHHGSKTSTSANFLTAVSPKYAVISVGKGNDYGHPYQGTMDRLKGIGAQVYRTDENGTIICTSDGTNISFNVQPGSYAGASSNNTTSSEISNSGSTNTVAVTPAPAPSVNPNNDRTVYYVPNGKSYHYDRNCSTLRRSKTILSGKLSDVINMGKSDPCNICVK